MGTPAPASRMIAKICDWYVIDQRDNFLLSDAAYYIVGISPDVTWPRSEQLPQEALDVKEWFRTLEDWEKSGRLQVSRRPDPERDWLDSEKTHTLPPEVMRKDLIRAFERDVKGPRPPFLFPDQRAADSGSVDAASVDIKPGHKLLIGALTRLLLQDDSKFSQGARFKNLAALKDFITREFEVRGLRDRSLDTLFAEGKKAIDSATK